MCLLVVVSRLDVGAPLVIGANRDERLDRPARAMALLRQAAPRILGGRDEVAGGTWLAVNEHGVAAGLTNRPSPDGPDPARRSRGELPIALCRHRHAASAVEDFVERFRPGDYNPAWLLVGDRTSLFALDMTTGDRPRTEELGAGVHVLENNPLHADSPKVDHVVQLLASFGAGSPGVEDDEPGGGWSGPAVTGWGSGCEAAPESGAGARAAEEQAASRARRILDRLRPVLADHHRPPGVSDRRPETLSACVHAENYGTRSSTVIVTPARTELDPVVYVADGPPCTAPFVDRSGLWR